MWEFCEASLTFLGWLIGEPWAARAVALAFATVALIRSGKKVVTRIRGMAFDSPEQEELYTTLATLVSSTNGWSKANAESIIYHWPVDEAKKGVTPVKPPVKVTWADNASSILMGNEDMKKSLKPAMVSTIIAAAKAIGGKLDTLADRGRINGVLATCRA